MAPCILNVGVKRMMSDQLHAQESIPTKHGASCIERFVDSETCWTFRNSEVLQMPGWNLDFEDNTELCFV